MTTEKDNERWLLSFYRSSEISGALFFGRLARTMRSGPMQADMTKHFADESQHASLWTRCIFDLGMEPMKLRDAYQDQYIEAAGVPMNMMEVLAITLVFERRVIGQYVAHARAPELKAPVRDTLSRIMEDERWHISWVSQALKEFEAEYGKEHVEATLKRCTDADREVYRKTLDEYGEVVKDIMTLRAQ